MMDRELTTEQAKKLLRAIFSEPEETSAEEPDDNYPETTIEKVGYSECVIIHALGNIAPVIQRLSRLHNLLILEEKDPANKLPDIIIYNELRMALLPLLQLKDDLKDITEMLIPIYKATKPPKALDQVAKGV